MSIRKHFIITLPTLIVATFAALMLQAAPAFASTGQFLNDTTATSNTSSNWAGYVETNGPYTAINGSWTVPAVQAAPNSNQSANAEWIGIGGVGTSDLIQTGTQAIIQNGVPTYQAWYELLPTASTPVPITVNAGDSMSASLTEENTSTQWLVSIRDNTNGQSYSTTVTYASSHTSAEWIEEMPSITVGNMIPLDNFGTVSFSNAFAMKNGSEGNLAANAAQTMTMIDSSREILAAPSVINSDNASFSVTRNTAVTAATVPSSNVQYYVLPGQGMRRGGGGAQGFQRASTPQQIRIQQFQIATSGRGQARPIVFRNNPYIRFQIQFSRRF